MSIRGRYHPKYHRRMPIGLDRKAFVAGVAAVAISCKSYRPTTPTHAERPAIRASAASIGKIRPSSIATILRSTFHRGLAARHRQTVTAPSRYGCFILVLSAQLAADGSVTPDGA
jgi:hypothetical protein